MFRSSWLRWLTGWSPPQCNGRCPQPAARRPRLSLERLEDRSLPSAYTAADVADLIADVNAANLAGGSNTITLAAGATFTLTAVDNTTDGATGLPVIAANDNLTIAGNGDTIARSTANGTPAFRLLDVAGGASLTLADLTLQGGLAFGGGVSAEGGAIYNQGTLSLTGVTVQNNQALGSDGSGIGGGGAGGGVFIAGGTAALDNVTLYGNTAQGGNGHNLQANVGRKAYGGNGLGGGLYAAGGAVSLHGTTVNHNTAKAGNGPGGSGLGEGGGLYLEAAASVCLDAFTQANITHNSASSYGHDVFGSYTTCP
jgi:hypothetical protein